MLWAKLYPFDALCAWCIRQFGFFIKRHVPAVSEEEDSSIGEAAANIFAHLGSKAKDV